MTFPPAPLHEESQDACCTRCGSLWHTAAGHPEVLAVRALVGPAQPEFPGGYDPAEADRLIGRDPSGTQ